MVAAELAAAVGMRVGNDLVDALGSVSVADILDRLSDAVYTADSRDDPDLVADTDLAVRAVVAHKGSGVLGRVGDAVRLILVLADACKVGGAVVGMDPCARLYILLGVSDGKAVFDDILVLCDIPCSHLVTHRDILERDYAERLVARLELLEADDDVIALMDSDCLFHCRFPLVFICEICYFNKCLL